MTLGLIALGVAALIAVAVISGNKPSRWERVADGSLVEQWPPKGASSVTIMGVQVAWWMENMTRKDNTILKATLVYEAQVPEPLRKPDPKLQRLAAHAMIAADTYGQTVRIEQTGTRWPEDNIQICTRLAIIALCGSRDYDAVVKTLLDAAQQHSVVSVLLLEHVDDPQVSALARAILKKPADRPLLVSAARHLKDVEAMAKLLRDSEFLTEADLKTLTKTLFALDPARTREVARSLLAEERLPVNAAELMSFLAPPYLSHDDASMMIRVAAEHPQLRARTVAIHRLSEMALPRARAAIVALVADENLEIAEAAAYRLHTLRDPGLRAPLLTRLREGNNDAQVFAASWLKLAGTLEDIEPLMEVRDKLLEAPRVRGAAAEAILAIQANAQGERGAFSLTGDAEQEGSLSLSSDVDGNLSLADDILKTQPEN